MRAWRKRSRWWLLAAAVGGSLLVLEGCDAGVRETVLNGIGTAATSLMSTFIQAFIESLQASDETATTVRNFIEVAPQIFA